MCRAEVSHGGCCSVLVGTECVDELVGQAGQLRHLYQTAGGATRGQALV